MLLIRIFPPIIIYRRISIEIVDRAIQILTQERERMTRGIQSIKREKIQDRLMIMIVWYHSAISFSISSVSHEIRNDLKSQE